MKPYYVLFRRGIYSGVEAISIDVKVSKGDTAIEITDSIRDAIRTKLNMRYKAQVDIDAIYPL